MKAGEPLELDPLSFDRNKTHDDDEKCEPQSKLGHNFIQIIMQVEM